MKDMNKWIVVVVMLVASCAKQEHEILRLQSPLPSGILAKDEPIIITFSKAVVPAESTNQWTNTQYIEFVPEIPGKFTWRDTSTLIFSPDGPYTGDAKFNGTLNTALLLKLARASKFDGDRTFTFNTESFRLTGAEFFYDRIGQSRTVGIKANLEFTYAANPAEVVRHMKVAIDDQQPQVIASSSQNASVIPVEMGTTRQLELEKHITITFDEELISPETKTHLIAGKPFVYTLPGLEETKIYGHEYSTDGKTVTIIFRTSQAIDLATAKKYISLDPAKEYTVEGGGQQIILKANFEPGSTFHVRIRKGMESVLGGKTQNEYEADIVVGNVRPSFSFASPEGIYMLLSGRRSVDIKSINLSKVAVRVSQIFQNNLVAFLNQGRSYDYSYGYNDEYNDDDEGEGIHPYRRKYRYSVGNYGRMLWYDSVDVQKATNKEVTTPFNLNPFLNTGYKGFYLLEISNPAEAWRSTSKLVSLSNLGLIVKQSKDEVIAFVTSLETNKPVQGATVSLISTNNQTFARAATDGDGVARFGNFIKLSDGFDLKLVTADLGNDFNFINLADYRVETSRFEVDGKRDAAEMYDANLYGDRNLYRPGEKMRISGILRNLTHAIPAQLPVRLKIYNPRGTLLAETQHTLNDEGSFETSYQTTQASLTGTYNVQLYTGNSMYLTEYSVSVEDFVPDRIKVNLTPSADSIAPGKKLEYDLLALNFFGPPAANRKYEFEGSFDAIPFASKHFKDFWFADQSAKNYKAEPVVMTGVTDEAGKASIAFDVPRDVTSQGLLRARARVGVFDESGRPVYQFAYATVFPKEYFIGLKNGGAYYVAPNSAQPIQIVAVDRKDKPIPGFKAKIDLVRHEWHSVLRQDANAGVLRYVSERSEIVVKSETVTLAGGPYDYSYMVSGSGDYALRVSKDGEEGYNEISFYSYEWASATVSSFPVNPEAHVQIVVDKPSYAPGEKARILFQAPFDGTMLVTVERNGVFSYRYLQVANNSAAMDLPIEESFLPNVYVSCVLFRKIKEMNIPLLAGHGFAPLKVAKPSNHIDVTIRAPEKIRPNSRQTVAVSCAGASGAYLTIAAVDEGILQLKSFKTPDLFDYFYQKKALETETFDFFKHLIPESRQSSPGGDEAKMMAKRVNPIGVMRFKPVALWSGIVTANEKGDAEVAFDIPDFSGELRIMAVAYKGDRFGSAQKGMKVADPIILTPALPRFLSPNDSLTMTITAFNSTETPAQLKLDIETSGGVTALANTASLDVGAQQERFTTVKLRATNQIGKAVVTVRTSAFGESFASVTELPVRPISPFVTDATSGFVDGGDSVTHDFSDAFLPYGRTSYMTLSPFPVVNFAKQLKDLVGYPHGCIEQTVSRAFPQIYLRDIATLLDPAILNTGSPTYFVNEAITKVASMQMSDGAFSYWPGGSSGANAWSTVYATHFLLEAKKAGYAVPENVLKNALAAVGEISKNRTTVDYYFYGPGQKTLIRRIADKSAVYALYVLALGGSPDKNIMNYFRIEKSLLTNDTQYLLAGAFALSGDKRSYLEILPPEFATEEAFRQSGIWFDSRIRACALMTNVLLDADVNNPNIPRLLNYLSKTYQESYWWSTQDEAFTLLAFGKAARMATTTKLEGTIRVGVKKIPYGGGNQRFDIDPFGKKVVMTMKGTGRVYYTIITEGIRSDGKVEMKDKNLQIRREFFNRFGNTVSLNGVKQNDLLIVRLTLTSNVGYVENIAISDLLPAGFEIENPRLTAGTDYPFVKNAEDPSYTDIRDDRINMYFNIYDRSPHAFYYMVRAVSAGTFVYPPVVAEAMYDANYVSTSGQGIVKVSR